MTEVKSWDQQDSIMNNINIHDSYYQRDMIGIQDARVSLREVEDELIRLENEEDVIIEMTPDNTDGVSRHTPPRTNDHDQTTIERQGLTATATSAAADDADEGTRSADEEPDEDHRGINGRPEKKPVGVLNADWEWAIQQDDPFKDKYTIVQSAWK